MHLTRNASTALRTAAFGAAFVLALGASGVAASVALADVAQMPTITSMPTAAPSAPAETPAFTLTNSGNAYTLTIDVIGAPVVLTYSVDPNGTIANVSTSTSTGTVAVDGHELTLTLIDGRVVNVELGEGGTSVEEVAVEQPDPEETPAPKETAAAEQTAIAEVGNTAENKAPEAEHTQAPEAEHTQAPEAEHTQAPEAEHTQAPEQQQSSAPAPAGGESFGGNDSGGHDSGSND